MASYNVFYDRTKRKITPLIFVTAFSFIVNLYILIIMIIKGLSISFLLFPIISATITLLFLGYQLVANFKMKYTKKILILYLLAIIALPIVYYVLQYVVYQVVIITDLLLICYAITSLLTIIFTIISTRSVIIYSNKVNFSFSFIAFILFAGIAVANIFFVSNYGVFGQGRGNAEIIYTKLDDGTLSASKLVTSKDKNVVINDTFNGIKVSEVEASIFNSDNIKNASINMDYDDFTFRNVYKFNNPNIRIFVKDSEVDKFKENLYNQKADNAILLSNTIVPKLNNDDDVYVSFNYNKESLEVVDYKFMHTIICKKGESINLTDLIDLEYVKHSNKNSSYDLDWNYSNNKGYILNSENSYNANNNLDVNIEFEKIYKVEVSDDNDLVYETSADYKSMDINGNRVNYILATYDQIDAIFNSFPNREGYNLEWKYKSSNDEDYIGFDEDYKEFIKDKGNNDILIKPNWEMKKPEVDESFKTGFNITYGDMLSFIINATPAYNNMKLAYLIYNSNNQVVYNSTNKNVSVNSLKPVDSGRYSLKIITSANDSSLKNELVYSFDVNIDKKVINFNWNSDSNKTFDGVNKYIGAEYDGNDVCYNDTISYKISNGTTAQKDFNIKNAGTYNYTLSLDSETAALYELDKNDINFSYTINKRKLDATWTGNTFTYNGSIQAPTVTLNFPEEDTNRPFVSYTNDTNISAGSYTINCNLSSTANYYIYNSSYDYVINPKEITVEYDATEFTYDGSSKYPTVLNAIGIIGSDTVTFSYFGVNTNVGNYTIGINSNNKNYVVSNATKTINYKILPRDITVSATLEEVTYGDTPKLEYTTSEELIKGNIVTGELSTLGKNVGTYDINLGTLSFGSNYNIIFNKSTLTINKRPITVKANYASSSFGDEIKELTYEVEGNLVSGDKFEGSLVKAEGNDKGIYDILQGTLSLSSNYELTYKKASYIITAKAVSVKWTTIDLVYDGLNHFSEISAYYEDINLNHINLKIEEVEMINAGNYTLTADFVTVDNNYSLLFKTNTYKINQATNTFDTEFNANDITYGEQLKITAPTPKYGTVTINYYSDPALSSKVESINNLDAKVYYANVKVEGTDNYSGLNKTYTFTVNKKDVNVVWNDIELTYDGENHFSEISAYYLDINSEIVNLTINEVEMIEAKTYQLVVSNNLLNYNLLNNIKSYEIREAQL